MYMHISMYTYIYTDDDISVFNRAVIRNTQLHYTRLRITVRWFQARQQPCPRVHRCHVLIRCRIQHEPQGLNQKSAQERVLSPLIEGLMRVRACPQCGDALLHKGEACFISAGQVLICVTESKRACNGDGVKAITHEEVGEFQRLFQQTISIKVQTLHIVAFKVH